MREVKKLKKGDKIVFLSASSAVNIERLNLAKKFFERMGFNIEVKDSCLEKYGYLAGSDEVRARDINEAFGDSSVAGIFCVRGGYGTPRIMEKLDYTLIKSNPKIFLGYSDVTALHVAFNSICDFVTYHTPMATTEMYKLLDYSTMESFLLNICERDFALGILNDLYICGNENEDINEIVFAKERLAKLQVEKDNNILENVAGYKIVTLSEGVGRGRLLGGNLSLLASLIGSRYQLPKEDTILFIEDIEEEPYRIDRMLSQLKLAGVFNYVKGVVIGEFTDCIPKYPDRSLTLMEVFRDILLPLGIPVVYNYKCGHCLPSKSLPLGVMVELDTKQEIFRIID